MVRCRKEPKRRFEPFSFARLFFKNLEKHAYHFFVLPLIAACGLALYYGKAYWESRQPIYVINLNLPNPTIPDKAYIVDMKGHSQERYAYEVKTTTSTRADYDLYTPLTSPQWTTDQPITVFLRRHTSMGRYEKMSFAFSPHVSDRGYFEKNNLPGHALHWFQEQGFKIAPTYYVFDDRPIAASILNSKLPITMVMSIAFTLGFAIVVGGGIGLLIRKFRKE